MSNLDRSNPTFAPLAEHPEAGRTISHADGAGRLVVVSSASDSDGELVEVEAICEPGPPGVPERDFEHHEVRFEVVEGRLMISLDGERRVLRAGEALRVEAGTRHRIWVESGRGPARFTWRIRPAPPAPDYLERIFGSSE